MHLHRNPCSFATDSACERMHFVFVCFFVFFLVLFVFLFFLFLFLFLFVCLFVFCLFFLVCFFLFCFFFFLNALGPFPREDLIPNRRVDSIMRFRGLGQLINAFTRVAVTGAWAGNKRIY
jgi:hypothetical protein